jgi:hypothetical protein
MRRVLLSRNDRIASLTPTLSAITVLRPRPVLEDEARARGEIVTLIVLSRGIGPHRQTLTENSWRE